MITRIAFQGLRNTRDLGGKPAVGGKRIVDRRLLRGEALAGASSADIRKLLNDYRLKLVIDLRMDVETANAPDPSIPGVRSLRCNLLDDSFFGIARDDYSVETWLSMFDDPDLRPEQVFSDMYFKLVFDDHVRPLMKEIFTAVAECDGAALWHCSAGKDRAGVVTMLMLYALGVPREAIVADYLATRRFTFPEIMKVRLLAPLKIHGRRRLHSANVLMDVNAAYCNRIFDEIEANFSDEFDFFKRQYDIPPALLLRLREKYLKTP